MLRGAGLRGFRPGSLSVPGREAEASSTPRPGQGFGLALRSPSGQLTQQEIMSHCQLVISLAPATR